LDSTNHYLFNRSNNDCDQNCSHRLSVGNCLYLQTFGQATSTTTSYSETTTKYLFVSKPIHRDATLFVKVQTCLILCFDCSSASRNMVLVNFLLCLDCKLFTLCLTFVNSFRSLAATVCKTKLCAGWTRPHRALSSTARLLYFLLTVSFCFSSNCIFNCTTNILFCIV